MTWNSRRFNKNAVTDPNAINNRERRKIRWSSHRGRAGGLDNTLAAFQASVEEGFDCLETDLRATSDGHIALCHDRFLGRAGGPADVPIDMLSRADLHDMSLHRGAKILFFDEFMQEFPEKEWIFDIKPENGHRVLASLENWMLEHDAKEQLIKQARFLFWRREQQQLLLRFLPEASLLPGRGECWRAGLAVLAGLPQLGGIKAGASYSVPARFAGQRLYRHSIVETYQHRGAQVIAYLPENEEELAEALEVGVDEVLTDFGRGPKCSPTRSKR